MTDNFVTVGVAVEKTSLSFDKLYEYIVPEEIIPYAKKGCRVKVSFGKGGVRQGMIIELGSTNDVSKLKSISEILDKEPVISEEMIKMAFFIKERYYCTLFDACSLMFPRGLSLKITYSYSIGDITLPDNLTEEENIICDYLSKRKTSVRQDNLIKTLQLDGDDILVKLTRKGILNRTEDVKKRISDVKIKMVQISDYDSERKYTPNQTEVLNVLNDIGSVSVKEICYFTGVSASVVDNLVKHGICEYYDCPPPISNQEKETEILSNTKKISLTPQQQKAYDSISKRYDSKEASVTLLYGITGSGKTSVFMKLIDKVSEDGKGVICMVPEISLTPQLLEKFKARYGNRVAVFHSSLSLTKRLEEWRKINDGHANIAVGTRSAIFAPVKNLGLIVMDEEQEYSYKSSSSPRFHARELAKFRCMENKCPLVLSSATPSVESYYFAKIGRYNLETLSKRYGTAKLPDVITVNMNIEQQQGNNSVYSSVLLNELEKNLKNRQQSIILLNRRGHNTFISCRKCGEVLSCPNCSISMTFHSANKRLMCHYCGHSIPVPKKCPQCSSEKLKYSGLGTQRAEQELQEIFPDAKILRLDTDSTMRKFAYEKKLGAFRDGEYDIMLGTQMVAKGLDFSNVTLVGVLSADSMMHNQDFRSYERTFSLLTQVVGRSGRGGLAGRAVIQTYEPENSIIELSAAQNYDEFFEGEILIRKSMLYPPFSDIGVVVFAGKNEEKVKSASMFFSNEIGKIAMSKYPELPMRILGPSAALISKINNKYRYKLIIKFRNSKKFRSMMAELLSDFCRNKKFSDVTAYIDIDPDTII